MALPEEAGTGIDTTLPHSARIWNYWLGGKDNYPVDREAGERFQAVFPDIVDVARAARAFLRRAVSHLAGPAGVRQFLDIGTGLPTSDNTHEVAQRVAPDARVVYVDNDPLVLAHANALLTSSPQGVTTYIDADLRRPETILAQARGTLDFDQPVALMLMGVLGHIVDHDEALAIVRTLVAALPAGSYLVHYDSTDADSRRLAAQREYDDRGALPYVLRGREQLAAYFDGLELLEPGIVPCPRWRPEPNTPQPTLNQCCGVGRKTTGAALSG